MPVRAWTATSVTPNCVFWSETSNEWRVDGVVLGGVSPAVDGTSTITCWTFHLSPFAIAEESSAPVEWSSVTLLGDTDVLLKVGRPKRSAGRLTGVVWNIHHFPTALGLGLVVELSLILPDPTQPQLIVSTSSRATTTMPLSKPVGDLARPIHNCLALSMYQAIPSM